MEGTRALSKYKSEVIAEPVIVEKEENFKDLLI